jgi:hypothetical protein
MYELPLISGPINPSRDLQPQLSGDGLYFLDGNFIHKIKMLDRNIPTINHLLAHQQALITNLIQQGSRVNNGNKNFLMNSIKLLLLAGGVVLFFAVAGFYAQEVDLAH